MGFFDRLKDFGDREAVRTTAIRIDVGMQQIKTEMQGSNDIHIINGLVRAVKQEIYYMDILARKLSKESLDCLTVQYNGGKVSYFEFLFKIFELSEKLIANGFNPLF